MADTTGTAAPSPVQGTLPDAHTIERLRSELVAANCHLVNGPTRKALNEIYDGLPKWIELAASASSRVTELTKENEELKERVAWGVKRMAWYASQRDQLSKEVEALPRWDKPFDPSHDPDLNMIADDEGEYVRYEDLPAALRVLSGETTP